MVAFKVLEDIRPSYVISHSTVLVMTDFSKGFDTVDHNLLLQKLKFYYDFNSLAINFIRFYWGYRCQCVVVGDSSSELKVATSGVPQRSISGPILFSSVINDFVACCFDCSVHLYVDNA